MECRAFARRPGRDFAAFALSGPFHHPGFAAMVSIAET